MFTEHDEGKDENVVETALLAVKDAKLAKRYSSFASTHDIFLS